MATLNSISKLLVLTPFLVFINGCGGAISSAAQDTLAVIDVADKLKSVATETPEVSEMPETPEIPEYPEIPETPEPQEVPDLSGIPEQFEPDEDIPVTANRPIVRKSSKIIHLNLHAAGSLNLDSNGRSLALMTKIYKLKRREAFQQAPYDTFMDSQREREALGADIVEVKEVTLIPSQIYSTKENISRDTEFIGIVGLFRAPVKGHWRATFPVKQAIHSGITVGMLGCMLAVGKGQTVQPDNQEIASYVRCQQ